MEQERVVDMLEVRREDFAVKQGVTESKLGPSGWQDQPWQYRPDPILWPPPDQHYTGHFNFISFRLLM